MKLRNLLRKFHAVFLMTPAALTATDRSVPIKGTLHCNDPLARDIEVYDKNTQQRVAMLSSVNLEEGWVECYRTDKRGRLLFKAPHKPVRWERSAGCVRPVYQDGWDEPEMERRFGTFEVRKKVEA